jgi:hypothetical protein
VVLDDLERSGRVELGIKSGEPRDRPVPLSVCLEQLESSIGSLRTSAPSGPIDGHGGHLLLLWSTLDDGADAHAGYVSHRTCHAVTGMRATLAPMRNDERIGLECETP